MQKNLRRLLAVLLAVCMTLTTLSIPAFAANGTASLSDTTMTESGSITVTFSQTATANAYYNVQIVENGNWNNKLVDTNVTDGDTFTISASSLGVTFSSSNTYQIYIGYCENGSWKSTALETTSFTVTADSTSTPTYTLELTVDDSNPSIDDTVTVTATVYADGSAVSGIPDGYKLSIWYQHNNGWVNVLTDSTSNTSGTISVSSSNFSDGSTYTVYGGLYTTGGETTATADVEFTVGTASGATGNYYVVISIEDDDNYQETYNDGTTITGSYVYSSTDTVNVKVVLMDGDTEKEVESFPSGYSVYVWFEDDVDDDNELEYTTTDTTITDTITISSYTFTTGNNYNVYARINYNNVEISGTMVSTSFTIETTYSIELSLNSVTTDYQEFSVGDVLSTGFTVTTDVDGSTSTSTSTPTGAYVTIYYQDDTGWHDLVYRLGSSIYNDGYGSNPQNLTLSSGSFSEGGTYTVYIELYNEGGEKLAYDTIIFTIPVRASFYTRTLTLDGAVAVNYYVDMTGVTDPENYTVVFSGTGITTQTATYNSGSYRDDFNGDTKYYRFTLELDSTQMALTFDAVLTYNGTTEVQNDSGYSVEKYCKSAIEGGWAEAGVCAALLNYGGYSQTYFNANTSSLANANLSTYDESWSDPVSTWAEDVSECVATVSNLPSEISGQALALVLNSETVIRLYFNASSTTGLTFTVDDTELTINTTSGDYAYYVEFSVQASRLKETFEVTVTNGTDTGTVSYSAYAYINTVVNGNYDTKLQNVCKALYYYAEAADEYSNWYTGTT